MYIIIIIIIIDTLTLKHSTIKFELPTSALWNGTTTKLNICNLTLNGYWVSLWLLLGIFKIMGKKRFSMSFNVFEGEHLRLLNLELSNTWETNNKEGYKAYRAII